MSLARTLMVQGTASNVGKSLLVTALCRYARQKGLSVAPFKSLNMALNAHVTPEGLEIARAQAVQAAACGIEPTAEMNPVLLKPEGNAQSQLVLLGRAIGTRSARELFATGVDVRGAVLDSLSTLRAKYDLVIIEGAGSPAEINLRERDIANMFVAHAADAPVLLAGDIDRGGVFAAFVGTLALLQPEDRARVVGFLVNKFRGDVSLLEPGLVWLREHTGIPVAGVVPHLGKLCIAEEDSLNVDARMGKHSTSPLTIAVLRLPRISNHDEFQPFEHEPDVALTFTENPSVALSADLLIVPGSKSTVNDLAWLRERGLDHVIRLRAQRNERVLGICGGCQMLGDTISDPYGFESGERSVQGIGLLPLTTRFLPEKNTRRVRARMAAPSWLFVGLAPGTEVAGYYIHAGVTEGQGERAVEVSEGEAFNADGAMSRNGAVIGTMVHGLFEDDGLRHALLQQLRDEQGLSANVQRASWSPEGDFDKLARAITEHCDTRLIDRLIAG